MQSQKLAMQLMEHKDCVGKGSWKVDEKKKSLSEGLNLYWDLPVLELQGEHLHGSLVDNSSDLA